MSVAPEKAEALLRELAAVGENAADIGAVVAGSGKITVTNA